ncbi:hypothetical protein IWQ62_002069 [Dispira parvispora]|uniref:Choline/carnitine acyltransferase domain-containing protein n=1 Tax=Dispira parvispora TaxID=1520584 RepID=A0A9W8E7V8_9FUNG|nr:hypothetical protein IWQ62_002069 [Dispira parvispora]
MTSAECINPEHTLTYQSRLPRLPVPTLQDTASRYLESLKPLVTKEQWEKSAALVKDFVKPHGQGEYLQSLLEAYARTQPTSWLETWWLSGAYLTWREPLVINSNYFILGKDDPNQPPFDNQKNPRQGIPEGTFTPFQIRRAAHLIHECLNYMEIIESGTMPVEKTRNGAQCMDQYFRMFGTTRIPQPGQDALRQPSPVTLRHIMVLAKDQVFAVPVFAKGDHRVRLAVGDIEDQLWQVVKQVTSPSADLDAPVGVLTGDHRDAWAELYAHLQNFHPTNAQSLELIQTALFSVSLDDYSEGEDHLKSYRNAAGGRQGHNRWFDKTIQIIVEASGRVAFNGEHAPCDALIPAYMYDYILDCPVRWPGPPYPKSMHDYEPPRRLRFHVDEEIRRGIKDAQALVGRILDQSELAITHFTKYGTTFIKRVGKLPPDAYVQIAIQLAYYRLHGKLVATYETGSTRKYLHGRTETIRTATQEILWFVQAMSNPSTDDATRYRLLHGAAVKHNENSKLASEGQAVDRHLFGLKMAASQLAGLSPDQLHPMFTKDPSFSLSSTWTLSTSSIHQGTNFIATGFGCAVSDGGYGINYMKQPLQIKAAIEGKRTGSSNVQGMDHAIKQALADMGELCEKQVKQSSVKPKL